MYIVHYQGVDNTKRPVRGALCAIKRGPCAGPFSDYSFPKSHASTAMRSTMRMMMPNGGKRGVSIGAMNFVMTTIATIAMSIRVMTFQSM